MEIIYLISSVLILVAGAFSLTNYIHMSQQNSYFNSRYFGWLKSSVIIKVIFSTVLFVSLSILNLFNNLVCSIILLVLSAIMLSVNAFVAVNKQKKAIKPLVFTPRVKRMYLTYFALNAVMLALDYFFVINYIVFVYFLSTFAYFTVMLLIDINTPAELAVSKHFINDAKRILKNNSNVKVIGITGSFGKTSMKYVLAKILQEKYNVLFTPGSINTPLGVVRIIREQLKPMHEIFICEMGAKNIGDIKEICDIVHPHTGIISSVGPQHLSTFKTVENVIKTKFELADAVGKSGGKIYLNFDNEYIRSVADKYDYVSYSTENGDLMISNITGSRFGTEFDISYKGEELHLSTKLLGRYSVLNIAGAVAIAMDLGVSSKQIKYAVDHLQPVEHRLQLKSFIKGSLLIDDAYNSNPSGAAESLNVLDSFEGFRKILVTPGMVELGEIEYEENKKFGMSAAEKGFEIILVGKQRAVPLADGIKSVENYDLNKMSIVSSFKEAMGILNKTVDSNCVVLFENDLPDNYSK